MNKIYIFLVFVFCVGTISAQNIRFSYQVVNPVPSQSKLIVYVQKIGGGTENITSFNFGFYYKSTEATLQGYPAGALDGSITAGETATFLDMSYATSLGWLAAYNSGSIVEVLTPPPGLPSTYNRRVNLAINDDNFVGSSIGATPVPIVSIILDNSVGGGANDMDSVYQLGADNDATTTYLNIDAGEEYPVIITGNRLQPLPIELITFSAKKSGSSSAYLTWSTASEINSSHFVIQRSFDKKTWTNAGLVNAAGLSSIIVNYSFVDENVYNGRDSRLNVYYRLQMFDLDGRNKYSPIEIVRFGNDATVAASNFDVYPNPATDGVQIEWDSDNLKQPSSFEFYDIEGKLVLIQQVSDNTNQEYIDFGSISIQPGVYMLRIMSGTEPIEHKQIVVGQNR